MNDVVLLIEGLVASVGLGWLAWASKTLIRIDKAVIGTEFRLAKLEAEHKRMWRLLDALAPRDTGHHEQADVPPEPS